MALPIDGQPAERHPTIAHYFYAFVTIQLGSENREYSNISPPPSRNEFPCQGGGE
jgi:hypothetical protein